MALFFPAVWIVAVVSTSFRLVTEFPKIFAKMGPFYGIGFLLGFIVFPPGLVAYGIITMLAIQLRTTDSGIWYRKGLSERSYPWDAIQKCFWRKEYERAGYGGYMDEKRIIVTAEGELKFSKRTLSRLDDLDIVLAERLLQRKRI